MWGVYISDVTSYVWHIHMTMWHDFIRVTQTCPHRHRHTNIHVRESVCVCEYVCVYVCVCARVCVCVCVCLDNVRCVYEWNDSIRVTLTRLHTHTHTHIHVDCVCVCVCECVCMCVWTMRSECMRDVTSYMWLRHVLHDIERCVMTFARQCKMCVMTLKKSHVCHDIKKKTWNRGKIMCVMIFICQYKICVIK